MFSRGVGKIERHSCYDGVIFGSSSAASRLCPSAARWRRRLRIQVEAPNGRCLCIVDRATGHPVGAVNIMANMPEHLKVELGNIWYSPLVQRTGANTEATYLMLRHAFSLGYRRVEWKCDSRNERSR